MARLVVVIDARRARQGAEEFARAQEQMRQSARRGAEDTQRANESAFDSIMAGLDQEISRRKAVSEALKQGTDEARIERRIQEALAVARAKGLALGERELAQIREKARASQQLANEQAEAFRRAANEEKDDTTEAKRKRMKETLNEVRGWVGDVGDAFGQVGQQLLGLSDAQTQAADTTIYMTEKGMALGEVFGPEGAIIGGVAGAIIGLATAESTAASQANALVKASEAMHRSFIKAGAALQFQKELETTYLGEEKLRLSLEDLSQINVSDITSKISELSKVRDGYFKRGQFLAAQNEIRALAGDLVSDKGQALDAASAALDRIIAKNREATEAETNDTTELKRRWDAAQKAVDEAAQAAEDYKARLVAAKKEEADSIKAAMSEYSKSDKGVEASQKLETALGRAADKTRLLVPLAADIGARHTEATQKAKAAQDRWNEAVEKGPGLFKKLGDSITSSVDGVTSGRFSSAINMPEQTFDWEKNKALNEKKKQAAEAAKQEQKSIAQMLEGQRTNIEAQRAILSAYQSGGEEAAKLEEAYYSALGGKNLNDKQKAELRTAITEIETLKKKIEDLKKSAADASKAAEDNKKRNEDNDKWMASLVAEADIQQQLALAIGQSTAEYEYQAALLPRLQDAKARGIVLDEKNLAIIRAAVRAQVDASKTIKDAQNATKEEAKLAKEKSPVEQWIEQYQSAEKAALQFQQVAISGIEQFSSTLTEALWGGQADWQQFFTSIGKDITQLIIKMAIAAALKQVIAGVGGGGFLSGSVAFGGLLMGMGSGFHSGGTVGAGGTPRPVNPAWFSHAPRYHSGGMVGLRPDEVPAILQRGEIVLSRQDVANGKASARNVTVVQNFGRIEDGRDFERHQAAATRRLRKELENA